jgi:hypothetical protein
MKAFGKDWHVEIYRGIAPAVASDWGFYGSRSKEIRTLSSYYPGHWGFNLNLGRVYFDFVVTWETV